MTSRWGVECVRHTASHVGNGAGAEDGAQGELRLVRLVLGMNHGACSAVAASEAPLQNTLRNLSWLARSL